MRFRRRLPVDAGVAKVYPFYSPSNKNRHSFLVFLSATFISEQMPLLSYPLSAAVKQATADTYPIQLPFSTFPIPLSHSAHQTHASSTSALSLLLPLTNHAHTRFGDISTAVHTRLPASGFRLSAFGSLTLDPPLCFSHSCLISTPLHSFSYPLLTHTLSAILSASKLVLCSCCVSLFLCFSIPLFWIAM